MREGGEGGREGDMVILTVGKEGGSEGREGDMVTSTSDWTLLQW